MVLHVRIPRVHYELPTLYIYYNYKGKQCYITKEQLLYENDEAVALEIWNILSKFIKDEKGNYIKLGGKIYYNINVD